MDDAELMAKYAANVTELRFGPKIKLCKRHRGLGWMLLVEGINGGHAMNLADGFLYSTAGDDVFKNPDFFTVSLDDAILMAEALHTNLGPEGRVVDPGEGFISRYLNPTSFEKLSAYWQSDEARLELKRR